MFDRMTMMARRRPYLSFPGPEGLLHRAATGQTHLGRWLSRRFWDGRQTLFLSRTKEFRHQPGMCEVRIQSLLGRPLFYGLEHGLLRLLRHLGFHESSLLAAAHR